MAEGLPRLLPHFTIVAADLTGDGASGKPVSDERHTPYSKRAMGDSMVTLMKDLAMKPTFWQAMIEEAEWHTA